MSESSRRIVVFLGLTGSGKSYLAKAWAEKHNFPYFNTDVIRKQLAGIDPSERRPEEAERGIYSEDFSRRTYDAMLVSAREALQDPAVSCVVLDGSYRSEAERDRVRRTFDESARVIFILCSCDEAVTRARLAERLTDAAAVSDGRWEIYLHQRETFQYPEELPVEQFRRLDTDAALDTLMEQLDQLLEM